MFQPYDILSYALLDIKNLLVNQAKRKSENLAEDFMNEFRFARILRERKPEVFLLCCRKYFLQFNVVGSLTEIGSR